MPEAMPLDQSAMLAGAVSNQRLPDNSMLPNLSNAPMPEQGNPEMQPNGDASNDSEPQSPIDEAVTELQSNPASYLSRMGVMASGESYQVTAAMPAKLRNRLGLEPGDKVLTVNGQSVGSNPGQDASILQQVKQTGEAQIEVQRGDERHLSRRGRQAQALRDGLLRHRHHAPAGGRHRAEPRRARHHLARRDCPLHAGVVPDWHGSQ